jgi:hypothetical protein
MCRNCRPSQKLALKEIQHQRVLVTCIKMQAIYCQGSRSALLDPIVLLLNITTDKKVRTRHIRKLTSAALTGLKTY